MRMTTNGIGVRDVSLTHTGISVYGNQAFMDWVAQGVHVAAMTTLHGEMKITLRAGGISPPRSRVDAGQWFQAYSRTFRETNTKFGLTAPLKIELSYLGGKEALVITMPKPENRAKLLRSKKAKSEALDSMLPLDVPKVSDNDQLVDEQSTTAPCMAAHTDPLLAVQNLVDDLNSLNKQLSGGVKLSQAISGDYYAVIQIHSREKS